MSYTHTLIHTAFRLFQCVLFHNNVLPLAPSSLFSDFLSFLRRHGIFSRLKKRTVIENWPERGVVVGSSLSPFYSLSFSLLFSPSLSLSLFLLSSSFLLRVEERSSTRCDPTRRKAARHDARSDLMMLSRNRRGTRNFRGELRRGTESRARTTP